MLNYRQLDAILDLVAGEIDELRGRIAEYADAPIGNGSGERVDEPWQETWEGLVAARLRELEAIYESLAEVMGLRGKAGKDAA